MERELKIMWFDEKMKKWRLYGIFNSTDVNLVEYIDILERKYEKKFGVFY